MLLTAGLPIKQIRQPGLQPRTACAGNGQGHLVFGLEGMTQHFLHFLHQFDELWVEMPQPGMIDRNISSRSLPESGMIKQTDQRGIQLCR